MSYRAQGIHHYLRLATAAAHSNLERVLATRGYFDSRESYVDYLQRFFAFHEEAERYLDAAGAGQFIPDWKERHRAHLARMDLEALGATEGDLPSSSERLPRLSGVEQVLGIAYVLEGSTLGGAFLLKQLAPLGISAEHGGRYLASYGNERGRMWQQFLRTLEEEYGRRAHAEGVASAALCAFNAARYYLTEANTMQATRLMADQAGVRARSMVA